MKLDEINFSGNTQHMLHFWKIYKFSHCRADERVPYIGCHWTLSESVYELNLVLEPFLFLKRLLTSNFHLVLSLLNLKSSQYNFPALCKENFKMHLSCERTFITSVALVVTFLDFSTNRLLSRKKNISDSPSSSSPCFSLCLLPLMFPRVILPVVWAQTLANLTFLRWSPNWGG